MCARCDVLYVYIKLYGTSSLTMHKPQCIITIFHRLIWFVSFHFVVVDGRFCCCYFESVDKIKLLFTWCMPIMLVNRFRKKKICLHSDKNSFTEQQKPLAVHEITRLINGKYFSHRFPSLQWCFVLNCHFFSARIINVIAFLQRRIYAFKHIFIIYHRFYGKIAQHTFQNACLL